MCTVCVQVEEGWWEGVLNGKTGMFPSNFTKEILTESDTPSVDTPTSQDELRKSESQQNSSSDNFYEGVLQKTVIYIVYCMCLCV